MPVNVNVVGRLGKDAEVIDGQKGQFLSFSLATDEFKNGERGTTWLRVNSNNVKMAEWLKKGKMVNVIGTETVRTYQDKNGSTQVARDVNAVSLEFVSIGSGQTANESSTASVQQSETNPATAITTGKLNPPKATTVYTQAAEDDDLPF